MEKQKRLHYNVRQRISALILSVLMVLSNIGFSLTTVYGAENSSDITFLVTGKELVRAVEEAVSEEWEVNPEDIEFTNGKIEKFETLFFGNGRLYEAYPEFEKDGGRDADLRVFVHLTEEELKDEEKRITGDEELIFLYLNNTDETISCQTQVMRRDLHGEVHSRQVGKVTLKSYEAAFGDEEVNITTDDAIILATPSETAEAETEISRHEIPLTESSFEKATSSEASDSSVKEESSEENISSEETKPEEEPDQNTEAEENNDRQVVPRDNDLVGVDWCSTAKVRITSLNKLKAFEDVTGFLIDYFVEPDEDLAKVNGPEVVEEGKSLRFSVTPKRGVKIETVTVNGEEILPMNGATPSEATPSQTGRDRIVYIVPELNEDAEVMIQLQDRKESFGAAEIVGGSSYDTIQEAIEEAEDGDRIRLLTDVDGESVEIKKQNLTIDLDGYIWTGAEEGLEYGKIDTEGASVITASDSTLSIVGMGSIQASEGYRAITAENTELIIGKEEDEEGEGPEIRGSGEGSLGITREEDSRKGGVILAEKGTVTLNSGIITDGYIQAEDEASPSETEQSCGGGIAVIDGRLIMNGGSIIGNKAESGNGGGLYISSAESIEIAGGEISENQAEDGLGGGIYAKGMKENELLKIVFKETTIRDNLAQYGGAVAVGSFCRSVSITEDTKTYGNQAAGDTAVGEARVSDEFLICNKDTELSDEFKQDIYRTFENGLQHIVQLEEGGDCYVLSLGGESAYDQEATGYYNCIYPDGIMDYELQDTLYYEDENISVALHIQGTAAAVNEEAIEDQLVATPSQASQQKGLILKAEPVEKEQPEYKAAERYAQMEGGDEGVVGLSAIELKFYCQNQLLDVSGCSITADITPKEPLIAAAKKNSPAKTFAISSEKADSEQVQSTEDTVSSEAAVALTALESDGESTTELGSVMIGKNEKTAPVLSVAMNSSEPMLLVTATRSADPNFTVQYYANLDMVQTGAGGQLAVIDTSGKKLPVNGSAPPTKNIYLTDAGNGKYQVDSKETLTEVYQTGNFQFSSAPGLENFNILQNNGNYMLKEVWILKDGKNSASIDPADWSVYTNPAGLKFTNNSEESGTDTIVIKDDMVIRLVYDPTESSYTNAVNFYDYDITDDGIHTGQRGINNSSNYSGSGAKLAFGNANTGTGLAGENWNGNTLNQYNRSGSGYQGCTFGLVTGLDENGYLQYAGGVSAPKLFNDGAAIGKTSYTDGQFSLQFDRTGDTYTLSEVGGTNVSGLEYFNHPQTGSVVYSHIWTNNFWPMDVKRNTDLHTGTWSGKYSSSGNPMDAKETYIGIDGANEYPPSDDGIAHNNMFGMQYAVNFTLSKDYIGPLEYYFFGDDDMWVFLDGTLVCDIGGVHSSVGEYVNLWDYLEKGSEGTHTLTFFYTERGLSGSSCYMQFTLPSVTSATPGQKTGTLTIEKQVEGTADSGEEFTFTLKLEDENGNELTNLYPCEYPKDANGTIQSGDTFTLKARESITINGLPYGTVYTIEETEKSGYTVSYQINGSRAEEGRKASGDITEGQSDVKVVYTNKVRPKLPETGGNGTFPYVVGGMALMALPPAYKFRRRKKEEKLQ